MREMKKAALLEEMIKVKEEVVQLRKTKTNDIYEKLMNAKPPTDYHKL